MTEVVISETELLAKMFAHKLTEDLGRDVIADIIQSNLEETSGVCHSHDHCDSNMVMAEAFREVFGRDSDPASDEDARIWSEAWEEAQMNAFYYNEGE